MQASREERDTYDSLMNRFFSPVQELKQNIDDKKYCTDEGCTKAADDMLGRMDQSVDPCDDFFKFACGGYVKKSTIPDHMGKKGMFSDLSEELQKQVINFILILIGKTDIFIILAERALVRQDS